MRKRRENQRTLDFEPSNLAITNKYYERYVIIDEILKETPKILDLVHADLKAAFEAEEREKERECPYTSDNILRS